MKTRHGFVSNSSSSSFLVLLKDIFFIFNDEESDKLLWTDEQIKAMLDYGFFYTYARSAVEIEFSENPKAKKKDRYCNLGYSIMCNQEDVINFLTNNNISFEAVCHYRHESVFYESGKDYYVEIDNVGLRQNSIEQAYEKADKDNTQIIRKIPLKKE